MLQPNAHKGRDGAQAGDELGAERIGCQALPDRQADKPIRGHGLEHCFFQGIGNFGHGKGFGAVFKLWSETGV